MFNKLNLKSVEDNYVITEDRWVDVLHHMQETLFWDKKLHGKDIENIMEALRKHKVQNDTDVFQLKNDHRG